MDQVWLRDATERVAWTFVQGALAAVPVEALATGDVTVLTAAATGGVAAVLSLLKTIAAKKVGDPHSAATRRQ